MIMDAKKYKVVDKHVATWIVSHKHNLKNTITSYEIAGELDTSDRERSSRWP